MQGKKDKVWRNSKRTDKIDVLYSYFNLFRFAFIYKVLFSCLLILLSIILAGCSAFNPPTDYYQKTLEMEESARKAYKESPSNRSGEALTTQTQESVKIIRQPSDEPPIVEVLTRSSKENIDEKPKFERYETQEQTQFPQIYQEAEIPPALSAKVSSDTETKSKLVTNEPISVSPEVIKNALEIAGINVRSVELVNGRTEGGKNSIRVNFICESAKLVNEKFFTICAVTYHLNKASKTIDVVIGIAEDSQSNLLGALQSNMEDVTAWMDNKITRAEWFSRIIRKML